MTSKRAPVVDMLTDIHKDERFSVLADVVGMPGGRYEAIGRMHALYSWCVDRKLADAPADCEGYAVSEAIVRRFLGALGVNAILGDGADELALAARRADGLLYLRGTKRYVAALRQFSAFASAGGKARSDSPRPPGRFVSQTTIVQPEDQPETSRDSSRNPAASSVSPLSSLLSPEENRSVSGKPDVAVLISEAACAEINRLARKSYRSDSKAVLKLCRALAKAGHTPEQAKAVVNFRRTWVGDPKMGEFFRPSTLLALENFGNYLDELEANRKPIRATDTTAPAVIRDDEPDLTYSLWNVPLA